MEGTTPKWMFQISKAFKCIEKHSTGESPEYMELIAVRIRKGCGKATDFSHNSIQVLIMSNETKKQRILKPDVAKLKLALLFSTRTACDFPVTQVDLISKTLIKNFKGELKDTSLAEAERKQRLLKNTRSSNKSINNNRR
ncbi:hypothetical protein J1N35_024194 [Gossypium stocksii]|uniref:Uncharacterized protein n=1 Tax=Gossypium stocksii TaxID=47602 RepID=A0A9D3VK02_9ROSI|nr:hypothetical protein J1N35_024194 [Gossypium stocksii]